MAPCHMLPEFRSWQDSLSWDDQNSSCLKETGERLLVGRQGELPGSEVLLVSYTLTEVQIILVDTFVKTQKGMAEGMAQWERTLAKQE